MAGKSFRHLAKQVRFNVNGGPWQTMATPLLPLPGTALYIKAAVEMVSGIREATVLESPTVGEFYVQVHLFPGLTSLQIEGVFVDAANAINESKAAGSIGRLQILNLPLGYTGRGSTVTKVLDLQRDPSMDWDW